jgi:hypothetical protein
VWHALQISGSLLQADALTFTVGFVQADGSFAASTSAP